jgi:hypothetical protein
MFGRATRCLAIAALATHLWVSMVVAPWHHLVAHRLPAATQDDERPVAKHCSCGHHHPVCESRTGSSDHRTPAAPDGHDEECPVCQVLTQSAQASAVATLVPSHERIEFSPPVSAVQPLLGASIDPVSRGPPAV